MKGFRPVWRGVSNAKDPTRGTGRGVQRTTPVCHPREGGKPAGPDDLAERVRDCQLTSLAITAGHGVKAGRLPPLHHDPFGRILVAQAQTEGLTVVTRDKWIPQYDVPVMHA
ncbi:type II toxin-antitoxin system VapC family toxin [Streptomyces sp. NPDC006289]|uniref:type II toxin-antitoxin system VapC family toxin n=1 Tax=Streptomyces sp. NPDC006289 TaxID=3156744 RepID=UPI0033B0AAE5